jgi:hypothetical protein
MIQDSTSTKDVTPSKESQKIEAHNTPCNDDVLMNNQTNQNNQFKHTSVSKLPLVRSLSKTYFTVLSLIIGSDHVSKM